MLDQTIAHGGTRRGIDLMQCTSSEMHDLDRLRKVRAELYRLAAASPDGAVSVVDLLYVLDGEQ